MEQLFRKTPLILIAKVTRRIIEIGLILLAAPFVILSRILQPILLIRYGYFTSSRIGHFAFDLAYYLRSRELDRQGRPILDLFFMEAVSANTFFVELSRRYANIMPLYRYLYIANKLIPFGNNQVIPLAREINGSRDIEGIIAEYPSILKFSQQEETKGHAYLRDIGCTTGKYVCLIVRDENYLKSQYPERDWAYHSFRNSSVDDYRVAVQELADRGYFVIRMGKYVCEQFNINSPNVVDYATSKSRSDFLDIWLMAHCQFAVSTGTGTDVVTNLFDRPVVYVNFLPAIDYVSFVPNITLFKKLMWEKNKEYLTLEEMLRHSYTNSQKYFENGITVVDLEPEEIKDAVVEMVDRLNDAWGESDLDSGLEDRYWKIMKASSDYHKFHGYIHPEARYSMSFLRINHRRFLSNNWLD